MASILDVMGTPPPANTLAWKQWYFDGLAALLATTPVEYSTKIYFSQSGDDTTGDGSINAPYKSLSKMSQQAVGLGPNVSILLKRGDVWSEGDTWIASGYGSASSAIDLDDSVGVTIGAYGTGALPQITAFVEIQDTFTLAASGESYFLAWNEAVYGPVGWVKNLLYANSNLPMHTDHDADQATLETLDFDDVPQGGFWYDTTNDLLYVRMLNAFGSALVDPTGFISVCPLNTVKCIDSDDSHLCRIDSLDIQGFGCFSNGQNYGVMLQSGEDEYNVISNCEVGYSGKHCIGMLSNTGFGYSTDINTGIVCVNCIGYGALEGSPGIAFASQGGHSVIYHNCSCPWDVFPEAVTMNHTDFGVPTIRKRGWYGHTTTGSFALAVAYGCSSPSGNVYAPFEAVGFANAPTAATLPDARVFVANCTGESYALRYSVGCISPIANYQVMMNNHFIFNTIGAPNNNTSALCQANAVDAFGWMFNCTIEHNTTGELGTPAATTRIAFLNTNVATKLRLLHNHFKSVVDAALTCDTTLFKDAGAAATEQYKNIVSFETNGDAWPGMDANATTVGNALLDSMDYSGDNIYDTIADSDLIELTSVPVIGATPDVYDQLGRGTVSSSPSINLEYDRYWNPRLGDDSAVGPVERSVAASATTHRGRNSRGRGTSRITPRSSLRGCLLEE